MQCERFVPNAGEEKSLGLKPFWWVYGTGSEIVDRYGYRLNVEILPDRDYFGIYIGDEIDEDKLDEFKLYSNKWSTDNPYVKVNEKYVADDGWKAAHSDKKSIGKPVNVKGHKCINTLPFGTKCAIVYDTDLEDVVLIPHYKYRYNKRVEKLFDRVVSIYGELDEYYNIKTEVEWIALNIFPCKEFASNVPAYYAILRGWQIRKILKKTSACKEEQWNDIMEYICIKIVNDNGEEDKIFFASNKWKYNSHDKVEPWMLEDNSFNKMWRLKNYSGRPCMINGHKCIVVYPFSAFNPVIWVTGSNHVFVLPAKAYDGDQYYEHIKEVLGKIPVYDK